LKLKIIAATANQQATNPTTDVREGLAISKDVPGNNVWRWPAT
jgi:hypothetical protein